MEELQPNIQDPQGAGAEKASLAELWAARQQRMGELRDKSPVLVPATTDVEAAAVLGSAIGKLIERRLDG